MSRGITTCVRRRCLDSLGIKDNFDQLGSIKILCKIHYIGSSAKECSNVLASSELISSDSLLSLGAAMSCISCTQVHSDCSSLVTLRLNTFQP